MSKRDHEKERERERERRQRTGLGNRPQLADGREETVKERGMQ